MSEFRMSINNFQNCREPGSRLKIITMLKFIFSLVLLCTSLFSLAQVFHPIEFIEKDPVWTYISFDSTLMGVQNFDGYNHFSFINNSKEASLRSGDYLYMVNATQLVAMLEGGFIVKVDLNTGKPIWSRAFDMRTSDRQENLEDMYIDPNGQLCIITAKRVTLPDIYLPYGLNSKWINPGDSAIIVTRKYNPDTGDLEEYIQADVTDPEVWRIRNTVNGQRQLFGLKNGEFYANEFIRKSGVGNDDYAYGQTKLDQYGNILEAEKRDTVRFEFPIDSTDKVGQTNQSRFRRVSEDTLISVQNWTNYWEHDYYKQPGLVLFDKNLNKVKSIKLDDALEGINFKSLYIYYADHQYIIIYAPVWEQTPEDAFEPYAEYLVLDYDGNVVRRFSNEFNGYRHHVINFTYSELEEEFLVFFGAHYLEGLGIMFLKTKQGGGLEYMGKLSYKPNDHVLFFYYVSQLENGDILIQGNNRTPDPESPWGFGYYGDWPTLMRIRAEDVGLSVDKDPVDQLQYLHIYPNPVRTYLNIDGLKAENVILRIYDLTGRQVMSHPAGFAGQRSLKMDVSSLGAGFYILKAFDAKGKLLGSNNFIKVE